MNVVKHTFENQRTQNMHDSSGLWRLFVQNKNQSLIVWTQYNLLVLKQGPPQMECQNYRDQFQERNVFQNCRVRPYGRPTEKRPTTAQYCSTPQLWTASTISKKLYLVAMRPLLLWKIYRTIETLKKNQPHAHILLHSTRHTQVVSWVRNPNGSIVETSIKRNSTRNCSRA